MKNIPVCLLNLIILIVVAIVAFPEEARLQTLATELVADGFDVPVHLVSPPGDTERLFVVELKSGLIKIIKNGTVLATPFLDVSGDIVSTQNEQGLFSLAFHPDYASNGYFFINYTGTDGATFVMRYTVSSDPDIANPNSGKLIFTIGQPFSNHNGGMVAFGPDGYLYIGMGDGGSGGDPGNRAQSPLNLLGKMLRLDIDTPIGVPYAIPPSNPFVNEPDTSSEIWALGLRNPWRFSFDRGTGDLYIADVGQQNWEELDFQPSSSAGGENYGWRCYEGNVAYNTSQCDIGSTDYVFPFHVYSHSDGCSITGGYVYRGCASTTLQGTYFFADYCNGRIWSLRYNGSTVTDFTERTTELNPPGSAEIDNIAGFGEDADGEIYILDYADGEIFKIVRDDAGSDCSFTPGCGNVNGIGGVDILDIVFLVNYKFKGGAAPADPDLADVNNDGFINILDIIAMVNFKFKNGPPLECPA